MVKEKTGLSLLDFVNASQLFDIYGIWLIALEMIKTFKFLNKNNIVHRYISPGNIVFNENHSGMKLIDFGLAKDILKNRQSLEETPEDDFVYGTLDFNSK